MERTNRTLVFRKFTIVLPAAYRKFYEELCMEWARRVYEYVLHRKDVKDNYLWYYVDRVARELEYVVKNHRRGKRVWPLFRIVFYESGKRIHGPNNSPIRIDLDRRRLKLRPLRVEVELSSRLIEEFRELISSCLFIARMVLRRKYAVLHIGAFREYRRPRIELPVLVVGIDNNSRYGIRVRALLITEKEVKIVAKASVRKRNARVQWRQLRWHQRLFSYFHKPEHAWIIKCIYKRIKGLNIRYKRDLKERLRKILRSINAIPIVVLDEIDPEGLRGSRLQNTIIIERDVENLVEFHNGIFIKRRISGRYCPVCEKKMRKYRRTRRLELYKCSCGILVDKHTASCYNAILWVVAQEFPELLPKVKEKIRENIEKDPYTA